MRGLFHVWETIMPEVLDAIRREPAGALLIAANLVGFVLVLLLIAGA